jgi:hypothetical protein
MKLMLNRYTEATMNSFEKFRFMATVNRITAFEHLLVVPVRTALVMWELSNDKSVILCQMIRHCNLSIRRLISSLYQRHRVFHCRRAYGLQFATAHAATGRATALNSWTLSCSCIQKFITKHEHSRNWHALSHLISIQTCSTTGHTVSIVPTLET